LEEAADPSAFESLAELLEDLLDTVEAHVSRPKGPAAAVAAAGGGGGGGATAQLSVDRLKRAASGARAAAKGYRAMLSEVVEMGKPQAAFVDLIDNRRETCFVPRPPGRQADGMGMEVDGDRDSTTESPHPYETEIRNFAYLPWQLAAPSEAEVAASVPLPLDDSPPLEVVDTEGALAAMVAGIREDLEAEGEGEKALAVDLEHHQVRSFQGLTCLMQLSTRRRDWVVDTLALRRAVGPALADLFADHTVVKVGWT
jgi:exosome complex exonuclease RRP6